jgi:redox-sensitive bicupin YhaK (pirin superfamily)
MNFTMKKQIISGHYTIDGAGVKIFRLFANDDARLTDPFLLFDNFGSSDPNDYIKGFPWHPHRGIETVTYMLEGKTSHEDSTGASGVIGPGDIQWMTAGSGIYHQEMPRPINKKMQGIQLWVNLPKSSKMIKPRYQDFSSSKIPIVSKDGIIVKIIAGTFEKKSGPVKDLIVDTTYLDIELKKGKEFKHDLKKGYTTICYVLDGIGLFDSSTLNKGQMLIIKDGKNLEVMSNKDLRYILISGKPLKEPIAWGGPIVMNTEEELDIAYKEIDDGTFIKK